MIGAGTWAAILQRGVWFAACQASVQDLDEAQIGNALARAKKLFKKRLRGATAVDSAIARLVADPQGKQIKHADVIIEAIVEKLDVKQKLFADLESKAKPDAVLATNTSSLKLEDIAKPLKTLGGSLGFTSSIRWHNSRSSRSCVVRERARVRSARRALSSPPSTSCP